MPASSPAPSSVPPEDPSATPPPDRSQQDAAGFHKQPAIHLLPAGAQAAEAHAARIVRRMGTTLVVERGAGLGGAADPAEEIRKAMRDAVVVQKRRLAKVFAGRIQAMAPTVAPGASGVPPSNLRVELATNEDSRTLHLESAWAWNLHALGARVGDIVQIDMQDPLVTIHDDPDILEGRVLDERAHLLRVSLGALDRAHAGAQPGVVDDSGTKDAGGPPDWDVLVQRAVRTPQNLLATGERPPTGAHARMQTDRVVRGQLGQKDTRLVPGLLLIVDAAGMPERARDVLLAALHAPAAPHGLLSESTQSGLDELVRGFPSARRLDPL